MKITLLFTPCQALPKCKPGYVDYSTLKAHISKTTNARNKRISDSESRHLEGTKYLRMNSSCTNNTCAKRCAEALFYLPPYYLKNLYVWIMSPLFLLYSIEKSRRCIHNPESGYIYSCQFQMYLEYF